MKKLSLIYIFSLLAFYPVFGQQDALFSQYMFNLGLVNPGYTGSRDIISLNAMYRKQWINLPGAPETMTFSADMPFKDEKMGAGFVVFNDRIGVVSNTGFYGNYAYRVHLTNNTTLALGASVGLTHYHADLAKVQLNEEGLANDAAFGQNYSRLLPNAGLGLFFSSDKFYVGFSLPHVFNNKLSNHPDYTARQYRHLYLVGGYVFTLSNNLKLKPSTLIKQVSGAPIQMDLNANLWLYDKYSIGVSYRSLDAPVFILELQLLEQLRLGYAFDYSHTRIRNYNNGTHEILLRYEFGYDKSRMITPRYF